MGAALEKLCFKSSDSDQKNYVGVKNNDHNKDSEQQKQLELESLSNQMLWFDRTKPILFYPKKFLSCYPEYKEDQVLIDMFEFSKCI